MATTDITQPPIDEDVEPFHIVYSENNQGPTMNIGVCVNKPVRDFIQDNKVEDPHLLVVIRQGDRDVIRKLVPLEKGLVHVTFTRPGHYFAYAMVVYPNESTTLQQMKHYLLEKDSAGGYERALFGGFEEHEPYREFSATVGSSDNAKRVTVKRHRYVSYGPIYVDAKNFAKPPAKWRVAIVRWFYPDNDRDQCHTRNRSIWSILWFFTLLPLHYLAKAVGVTGCWLFGFIYEDLNVKASWKPFRHGSFDLVFGGVKAKRSAWYYKRVAPHQYKARPVWWNVGFTIVAIEVILTTVGVLIGSDHPSVGESFVKVLTFEGVIVGIFAVIVGLTFLVDVIKEGKIGKFLDKRRLRRKEQTVVVTELQQLDRKLATMSCETTNEPMTIEKLKRRRRLDPVVVWHSTKDRMCKPYAR